jgi:fructose-1,6-bisphosphatase/inositol monophosphatase family enzyme
VDGDQVLGLLVEVADAVADVLRGVDDWGLAGAAGTHPGQHHSDRAADAVAVELLGAAGCAVLSEESGAHAGRPGGAGVTVVVDPLDGSTNAAHGVPWYATSLCAVDASGPLAAVVANLASGRRFTAVRGGGARLDGSPITASGCAAVGDAFVGLSGFPARHLGWRQYRALGAAALDLCAVACGVLDAYVDCSVDAHGPWDYLGGLLVCREAGAAMVDAWGRELVVTGHDDRRTPVAAATPALLAALVDARRGLGGPA